MGNRAITYFYDGDFSSGCYVHWNGGRVWYYLKHSKLRAGCALASCARFAAECCKRMPGNLSVYMYNTPGEDEAHALHTLITNPTHKESLDIVWSMGPGDNGTYIVDVRNLNEEGIKVYQISCHFENRKTRADFNRLHGAQDPDDYKNPVCRYLGSFPALPDLQGSFPGKKDKVFVESSLINSYGVSQKGNLLIEFKNGSVYRYYNIDKYTVCDFEEADSKGRYFNKYIKGYFPCKQVKRIPKFFSN